MPDWSYRTVFKPLLSLLPPATARDCALGFLGRVAAAPLGGQLIDLLGHMRPDFRLRTPLGPRQLASPVVIGPYLDPQMLGSRALARFGVGMIEVGPVNKSPADAPSPEWDEDRTSLVLPLDFAGATAGEVAVRLAKLKLDVRVMVRLADDADERDVALVAPYAAAFSAELAGLGKSNLTSLASGAGLPLFAVVAADAREDLPALVEHAKAGQIAGIVIDGSVKAQRGGWRVGAAALVPAIAAVRQVRQAMGPDVPIIAGGVVDPEGAIRLFAAGANAVQADVGLVVSGPGLCKRINEAALFARCRTSLLPGGIVLGHLKASSSLAGTVRSHQQVQPGRQDLHEPHAAAMSWFWALLLAVAMLGGGAMATLIAATRVVLPYDEAHLGMTAAELTEINPRLLDFMTHDRITLAGTMLAVGVQYSMLAWFGIRRGLHWAKVALLASAFSGFFTFFLFLGFGYFDPFHAFVTAINFQFVLLAWMGRLDPAQPPEYPSLRDDRRWRLAQWGQLLLILHAGAVIAAGITICIIGSTSVFVAEDLEFMRTTADALHAANPRLVPVVAHDRASFGGMLLAVGLATLLAALWGIRQGATWLWWMFALSATVGYGATLVVHAVVGYTDPAHLAPAIGGLALHWLALSLLFPSMKPAAADDIRRWDELLSVQ